MIFKKFYSHKEDLLVQTYFTGSMPLLMLKHSSKRCGGPKALSSTTMFEKYGVELAQEGRNASS